MAGVLNPAKCIEISDDSGDEGKATANDGADDETDGADDAAE